MRYGDAGRRLLATLAVAGVLAVGASSWADYVWAGPEGGPLVDARDCLQVPLEAPVRGVVRYGHPKGTPPILPRVRMDCPAGVRCWVQVGPSGAWIKTLHLLSTLAPPMGVRGLGEQGLGQ